MPAVAYDLEDNLIFKALKKKKAQVKHASKDQLKCIFLFDAGCSLLRNLKGLRGAYEVSGERILQHSLRKLKLDLICVFSITRDRWQVLGDRPKPRWMVTCFDARTSVHAGEHAKLQALADHLPTPRYETYQARDLDRQGLFGEPRVYEHIPSQYEWTATGGTVKISTRLLLALLAGKIDHGKFESLAFQGNENPFANELKRGHSIRSVKLEFGGLDQDDDHAVFELGFDWRPYERRKD
jgi:hypothetical protein